MAIFRIIVREAFLPATALLVVLTITELLEPGFTAGVVNMPVLTVAVVALGFARVWLDWSGGTS